MKSWITAAGLGALLANAAPFAASGQAQSPPATNSEALALGKSIVETAFPAATRQAMMDKLMTTMLDQMKAGMQMDRITDPGLRQILSDYLAGVPALLQPTTRAIIPRQMDAVAQAYARMFSLAELKDIAAFAKTPSGTSFLQRSTEVMSDPAVAAVNTDYFGQIQAINARTAPELGRKVEAHLKAHPEAAKHFPSAPPAATPE
jgi:hypothetical protein